MDAVNKSWLIDGLLVDIGDTLSQAKFTELVNLYKDVTIPDGITEPFRVLKYLKDKEKLELGELATNLEDIGCEDQSQKVRKAIKAITRERTNSAALVGLGGVTSEIKPEEASPGSRKKGTNDQDDPLTDDAVVEEIPCQEADDNDNTYMKEAIDLREKSEDKNTKVGSILVHPQHWVLPRVHNELLVIGRGYNRMPIHQGQELDLPWTSQGGDKSSLDTKYLYVVHSAIAAIINATEKWTKDDIEGSTMYTTLFPANRDAQMFVDYGIRKLVFMDDIYKHRSFTKASKLIMEKAGIEIKRLDESNFQIPRTNYIVN